MTAVKDDDKDKTIIKLLAAMAWADGRVDSEELRVVEAMIESFGVDDEVKDELITWAKTPRTLDDVDASTLSQDDAELVLHQAVLLSFVDGEQSDTEIALLNDLTAKLRMSDESAESVMKGAVAHAHSLLPLLDN